MFIQIQKEAYYNKREISREISSNLAELIKNEKNAKDHRELALLKIMMSSQSAMKQENPA